MTKAKEKDARHYVRSIKNEAKGRYADQYLAYLLGTSPEPEPMWDAKVGAYCIAPGYYLSVMGCQAVRMRLREIVADEEVT